MHRVANVPEPASKETIFKKGLESSFCSLSVGLQIFRVACCSLLGAAGEELFNVKTLRSNRFFNPFSGFWFPRRCCAHLRCSVRYTMEKFTFICALIVLAVRHFILFYLMLYYIFAYERVSLSCVIAENRCAHK